MNEKNLLNYTEGRWDKAEKEIQREIFVKDKKLPQRANAEKKCEAGKYVTGFRLSDGGINPRIKGCKSFEL